MSNSPAVFLDRDGTVIVEKHYLSDPAQVELLPGAAAAIRRWNLAGLKVLLVTNQSGVGRGYFDVQALDQVHDRMRQLLAAEGAAIDQIYVCPHLPDEGCRCRKPGPGLAEAGARDWNASLQRSFVIGDKVCDIHLGDRIGATSILVRTGYGAATALQTNCDPDFVCDDLPTAAVHIMRLALGGASGIPPVRLAG